MKESFWIALALAWTTLGCGAVAESDMANDEEGALDPDAAVDVATRGQAVSATDPDCWEEPATVGFYLGFVSGNQTSWASPEPYPATDCAGAFLVDVNEYSATYLNPDGHVRAKNPPVSSGECARWRIGYYMWVENNDGTFNFVDSAWRWGEWNSNTSKCNTRVNLADLPSDGYDVRIAGSVRRHDVAGSSTSGYVTKSIRFVSY